MRILLDSNAYSGLMAGRPGVVRLARRAEEILLPIIVLGELLYGFRNGSRYARNVAALDEFLASRHVAVPSASRTTADRYARIAASLRAKGRPIPSNDIWIAASTMETGTELVSYDRHFEHVDGLAWTPLDD